YGNRDFAVSFWLHGEAALDYIKQIVTVTPLYRILAPLLKESPAFATFREALTNNRTDRSDRTYLTNVVASLDALLIGHSFLTEGRPFLLLVEEAAEAERMYDDLARLLDEEKLALFSEGAHASLLKRERQKRTQTAEATAQLLEAIDRLARATEPLITIADAESLATLLPSKREFAGESLPLTVGMEAGFDA